MSTFDRPENAGSSEQGGMARAQKSSLLNPGLGMGSTRDSRAQEAIRMKDEQLRILTDQNSHLLKSLDQVEEEANTMQLEKLAIEEEDRKLRDQNFELQSKARAADAAMRKAQAEMADKDKQLKIMTDQNSELLRLLETEESQTAKLEREGSGLRGDLESLRSKYSSLLTTAKTHEEMASKAAREGQLRAEELRLLRSEVEQLRGQNAEMRRKTQVEIESLHEQLRIRKEKQYHLLEKMQGAEETKRQAEDQVTAMEEKLRALHARTVELETQLQVEARAKRAQMDANKALSVEGENLATANRDLQDRLENAEQERMRMEAEARDSGEQLREMAEKVFQLLERLKLAEIGKTKAVEALRKKEQELVAQKKKNGRLLKESTLEGKARVKAELDKKVLVDQIRALKKHNAELSSRCRDEVKAKLSEHEDKKQAQEKVRTLGGRLSFLLNKLQSDEEAKIVAREEMKKMEAQLRTLSERNSELSQKLGATGESNRIITHAMRLKQEELQNLAIRHEALSRQLQDKEVALSESQIQEKEETNGEKSTEDKTTADDIRIRGGKGVYFVDARPTQGLLLIGAKTKNTVELMNRLQINEFLKRAQKSVHFKERLVEKVTHLLGLLSVEEGDRHRIIREGEDRSDQIDHLSRKTGYLQERLHLEEEAKRRTLLRYVHSVKEQAASSEAYLKATGQVGSQPKGGVLQLPESGIGDEEVHALAALLRGNMNVTELNLRSNIITDEGARALGAVLAGLSGLKSIDLRENKIGKNGIRGLAEALERAGRVRHVYVHAGGKIEALGTGMWAAPRPTNVDNSQAVTVETVCVLDVRNNRTENIIENQTYGIKLDMSGNIDNSTKKKVGDTTTKVRSSKNTARKDIGDMGGKKLVTTRVKSAPGKGRANDFKDRKRWKQKEFNEKKLERQRLKRENRRKEGNWSGRSGGISTKPALQEVTIRKKSNSQKNSGQSLPPLGRKVLSASAPLLNSADDVTATNHNFESKTIAGSDLNAHIQRAAREADGVLSSSNMTQRAKDNTRKKKSSSLNAGLMKSPLLQSASFKR